MDVIIKFVWASLTKNFFAIGYSNFIRIGALSSSASNNTIKTLFKIQIGKPIKDFDCIINESK